HTAHREHMAALLGDAGYQVVQAGRGDEAWALLKDIQPDLLLTDVVLPGIDGFELAWRIAAEPMLVHTRIVVSSTGFLEEQARQLAEACGVSHFVGKPVQREPLVDAVRDALAHPRPAADIDHFAQLHEGLSTAAGDALLRALGSCLGNAVRGEDVVCRYDGEQFLLLMPGACLESATERAETLSLGLQQLRVLHDGQCIACPSLSFGVAVYPEHGDSAEELLQSADAALHLAKVKGRNRVE